MIETASHFIIESQEGIFKLAEMYRLDAAQEIDSSQHDEVFNKFKGSYAYYAHRALKIKTKSEGLKTFSFNKGQWYLHAVAEWQLKTVGKVRIIVVKGRQQGISTYVEGRGYWKASQNKAFNTTVLTHEGKATDNLFDMFKRYHDNCPDELTPTIGKDNSKQLEFTLLDSVCKVFTAGAKGTGRSQTSSFFHGCLSEDSLIVLASGETVSMGNISVGDLVVTSSGSIAPVKNKIFTGEKQTYTLETWVSGEPIHLTGDHKVLTVDGYKKLEELGQNDFIAMPKMESDSSIFEYEHAIANVKRKQGGGSKHKEHHTFKLDSGFGYFLGYYLAEGHVKDNLGYITFTYEKSENYINKALSSVSDLFTSRSDKTEGSRGITTINGKFLASAVNEMVGRVDSKRIPEWMFNAPSDFLDGLFRGYYDGDGSKTDKDKLSASSIHEKISRQLHRITLMLYGASSVKRFERSRYGKKTKDIYLLRMSGNPMRAYLNQPHASRAEKSKIIDGTVYCRVKSITPRKIEKVWDIEVDHEDHNYQTTAGIVSNSEVAFWPHAEEHATGIMEGISEEPGTEVYMESTAYGNVGLFATTWEQADYPWEEPNPFGNGYVRVFIPWYWEAKYRSPVKPGFERTPEEAEYADLHGLDNEQLQWRREKIAKANNDESRFCRDYPATPEEAFNSSLDNVLIQPNTVLRARKNFKELLSNFLNPSLPAIIGCDVAREGDDATCIVVRQGRVILHYEQLYKAKGSEVAKRIVALSNRFNVLRAFVDNTGGFGGSVLDFLSDVYGYDNAIGVHFNEKAHDSTQFKNIRSEMWFKLNDWLEDGAAVPDSAEMQKDFCSPTYRYMGDLFLLEPKEEMKRRGIKSPDIADACALTFAHPVTVHTMARSYEPAPNEV